MPEAEMTPKQRREGAPLVRLLEEKLISCHNDNGELNLAAVAAKLGRTRQGIHYLLNKEVLSPAVAWDLVTSFPRELTVRDLKPFVSRAAA